MFFKNSEEVKVSDAEKRVRTCEANLATLNATSAEVHEALRVVEARFVEASRAFEAAADSYRDEPSDKAAKAVQAARERRDLVELELARPRKRALEADDAVQVASRALADATEALRREEERREVERLRTLASKDSFRAKGAPLAEKLLRLRDEVDETIAEYLSEFDSAAAAAATLRERGVECDAVRESHLVTPICFALCERDRSLVEGVLRGLNFGSSGVLLDRASAPRTLRAALWAIPESAAPYRNCSSPRGVNDLLRSFETL